MRPSSYVMLDAGMKRSWSLNREDAKKHGILCMGYRKHYAYVETFMRMVCSEVDPEFAVQMSLAGMDYDLSAPHCLDGKDSWYAHDAQSRIFSFCVLNGICFDGFLRACAETKALDSWFLSSDFMDNVYGGNIASCWWIKFHHENGDKRPYRDRFKRFIASLDDRGLEWTKKYLEPLGPNAFHDQRKAYWLKDEK